MKISYVRLRVFTVTACFVAGAGVIGQHRPTGIARADDTADAQHVQEMIEGVNGAMSDLSEAVGGLSDEQKPKLAALETSIAEKIKANPKIEPLALRDEAISGFRDILTPDQQKKLDELMADSARRAQSIQTGSRLKQIGIMLLMFATEHQGELPPDLGLLTETKPDPTTFLAGGSKTKVPVDFEKLPASQQAEWIDTKTDFIFVGGGKDLDKLGASVVAYVRPGAAATGNNFLMADGSVVAQDPEKSAKIIGELEAGKNPPPSLDKTLPLPPGPPR